jgi:2-C-methyl-D-erythritol 4-phosphate cytidylyltransferase
VVAAVRGGSTRAESVRAALAEVPEDALVVLVHDAARPLLTDEVLERVLAPLSEGWDGVVPGLPVVDTVKTIAGDAVTGTASREKLIAVQTPQAFVASKLREAYAGDLSGATDCSSLVEAHGGRVTWVEGDPRLLKVTTKADLEQIAAWL